MVRALTAALVLGLAVLGWPAVVVNEFGQGRAGFGEWVELLVVGEGPGTAVDLRGWSLQDYYGDSRGGVYVVFPDHEFWAKIPAGTIIVIYNGADAVNLPLHFPKDDLDPKDFVLVIPGRTGELLEVRRWEGLANSGDCIFLVRKEGEVVFRLSYGQRQCGGVQLGDVGRGQAAWYLGGALEGLEVPENWWIGRDGPDGSTPGAPNSADNAAWIAHLRAPQEK